MLTQENVLAHEIIAQLGGDKKRIREVVLFLTTYLTTPENPIKKDPPKQTLEMFDFGDVEKRNAEQLSLL